MSKLGSLIALLGAGVGGYAQGEQVRRNNERQDRLDAQQTETYQYEKEQRDKQRALDKDLADSQADQSVEEVAQPDMSGADITMAGQQTPQYRANGVLYGDRTAADQALAGANSMASKNQRAADVMRKAGQIDKAQVYDAFAKRALDEGTDKILGAIQAARPTVDQVKAAGGTVAGSIGEEAADVFNKSGAHWKVAPDTVVQHYVTKDAAGREIVNSRVLGKDGKPVIDDVDHAGLFLQDFKTRMESKANDTRTFQAGQQIAQGDKRIVEDNRHNVAVERETAADHKAARGIAQGQLDLAKGKDLREATLFKNQTVEGQLEQLKKAGITMTVEDERAYRKKLLGIGAKDSDTTTNALVDKLVEKFGETNTDPGVIAKFRGDLQQNFAAVASNRKVADVVKAEFTKNPFGTSGYAQTYNDAKTQLRLSDADLQQMGYKPPPAAKVAAKVGTTMPVQSAPATVLNGQIDVRADPTISALNAGIKQLDANDPKNVDQLMKLGTAKNARIQQLQDNYGSMARLITD